MRIGMILDKTFPPDPRVENEAQTLIEAGFEVFLFCLTYDQNQTRSQVYNGINIRRYLSNKLTYKLSALAYTFPFYKKILFPKIDDFIVNNKIDYLHIHDIRIAETVFEVNKKFKIPVVLDLHDNYPEVMKEYPHLKKFPGKYLISPKKWLQKENEFILKSDRIITVSDEFSEIIKNRLTKNKDKVVLVPNTVRKSFYTNYKLDKTLLDTLKNDFVLLYIGDTGLRRGLLIAINAIPELSKTISNIKLLIVGTSSSDAILKQRVKDLNIEEYVRFEGWKNPETFPSYIHASSIGISPLIRSKQHDVAYANKIFQYMSFGKPILVSDATAQKKIVENNNTGLVHKNNDSADFVKKVLQLYQDKERYTYFSKQAKLFIEASFNWEITAKNLVKMYLELADK